MGIFNKEQDRYRSFEYKYERPSMFGGFSFFPPVIKYLLISNVFIFIVQIFLLPMFRAGNESLFYVFMKSFALNPIGSSVLPFYPWQLVTYMFMHGNFWHLFLNMFALWMFGMELENIWGSKKFLTYYLICGIGAGIANLIIAPLFTTVGPTIGASGSIYGVLVAFGVLFPDRPIFLYFLFPIKAKYFVLIYMIIALLSVGGNTGIAHVAHLGGGVVGFIYLVMTNTNISRLFRFDRKPRISSGRKPAGTVYQYKKSDENISDAEYYTDEEEELQKRVDEILDKISREGYKNLSDEEKKILFEASKKIH